MQLLTAPELPSLCPAPHRASPRRLTVALVQTRWHEDVEEHRSVLAEGIALAVSNGAQIVLLPELTMSRYMADTKPGDERSRLAEDLNDGPSAQFFTRQARLNHVYVNGSLFERTGQASERGFNTSVLVNPAGRIVQRTRKMHIPVTAGYYENEYFSPGPASPGSATGSTASLAYQPVRLDLPGSPVIGLPTCWDEWFPEVARIYSLQGTELLSYPTAIGSEPDYPDFDTQPIWQRVIVGNAAANGLFMVVPNRYGNEGTVTFYGSSFIADPFGRVLTQAPREGDAVLIAHLDLEQRNDWLTLFPFLETRRPESYGALVSDS